MLLVPPTVAVGLDVVFFVLRFKMRFIPRDRLNMTFTSGRFLSS